MATTIKSDIVVIPANTKEVFDFIADFNNIRRLLPEDKISDWHSTKDDCSFKIQNAAIIPLVKSSVEEPNLINIVSGDKAPFPFTLKVNMEADGDNTIGGLVFEGDINPFLKMMVMSPLTNLFNYMANKLKEIHESK